MLTIYKMLFIVAGLAILTTATKVRDAAWLRAAETTDSVRTVVEHWPNGRLKSIRYYDTSGRKTGTHLGWWPNGRLKFQYSFKRGLNEGEANEWLENGTPYRAFHYRAGKEYGSERMWYEDGTLRANYIVKDGRRFGLMGSKPCLPSEGTS